MPLGQWNNGPFSQGGIISRDNLQDTLFGLQNIELVFYIIFFFTTAYFLFFSDDQGWAVRKQKLGDTWDIEETLYYIARISICIIILFYSCIYLYSYLLFFETNLFIYYICLIHVFTFVYVLLISHYVL